MIIADLGMPVEDGFSLMRDVREQLAPRVPGIALSAYADHGPGRRRSRQDSLQFLAKPTRADTLLQLVESLLKDVNVSRTR